MKMTYFWMIYTCLIFGSGILCDGQHGRRQAATYPYGHTEEKLNSLNENHFKTSKVCNGHKDCSDGSDVMNTPSAPNMITDCGKVNIHQGCLSNGQKAPVGSVPWNAGLYRFNKRNSNYELICGGSLISSNLVISAARCFWDNGTATNRIIQIEGLYKIAVGKYDRNISIIDNIFTQIVDVDTVYLKEAFYGSGAFYAEDIAVVVLKTRVTFSRIVAPVCVDWYGKSTVVNDELGKIVGWGCSKNGTISNILLELSLPYIDYNSCRMKYNNGFEVYITYDKFCAGYELVAGEGVDVGYAGSGLSYFVNNAYYLTGITNVKDPDTTNSISLFTRIDFHREWLREMFDRHK